MTLKFFSKKEYQEIAIIFNLGTIREIICFRKGFQTPKVFVKTSRGKFIISKHNLSSKRTVVADMKIVPKTALLYEIQLLNTLKNLPVPHYMRSRKGEFVMDYKGVGVTVYKFLNGTAPRYSTPKMAYQIGEFLGKFHIVGNKFRKYLSGRREFYNLTPRVMTIMRRYARRQASLILRSVVKEVEGGVERNRPPKILPRGPIHVDIKPENELFIGEKLTGVLDWGNFYLGPLMVDVGKAIMWNCCKNHTLKYDLLRSFMYGYARYRKLNKDEQSYLKGAILFAIYSHIWVDLYHISIKYVPERYTLYLVKEFLPVARSLEKGGLNLKR